MKKFLKILTATVAMVAITFTATAQSIPSASPANNPLVKISSTYTNVNHNALTNTGTFTNVVIPVLPDRPATLWVIITNCPSVAGAMRYHFDSSSDNGSTYTKLGLASNAQYKVTADFNTNTSATTTLFSTNLTAAQLSGITHLKLNRGEGTTATNVYTWKVGITQPAPVPY